MAAITFKSLVYDISSFLSGCPNLTIEMTMRKIITDLCQRGKVWRDEITPITTVVSTYQYTPTAVATYGEFSDFLSGSYTQDSVKTPLTWISYEKAIRLYPDWPLSVTGRPLYVTSRVPGKLLLCPTPDAVGTVAIYAAHRPKRTADSWEDFLYSEFHRAVFHGVMNELMSMKDRSWSDPKQAVVHGRQWTYLLNEAKIRAETGFNKTDTGVEMTPFA